MTAAQQVIPEWSLGDRLRKVRREVAWLQQAEFAEDLGVTRTAYAAWEAGTSQPRGGMAIAIALKVEQLTGVPAMWLLGLLPTETGGVSCATGTGEPRSSP